MFVKAQTGTLFYLHPAVPAGASAAQPPNGLEPSFLLPFLIALFFPQMHNINICKKKRGRWNRLPKG